MKLEHVVEFNPDQFIPNNYSNSKKFFKVTK